MKTVACHPLDNRLPAWSFPAMLLGLFLALSASHAKADYEYWYGNDDAVWNDQTSVASGPQNWSGRVPQSGDLAIFNASSTNMSLTFSATTTPAQVFFNGNGAGYTLGAVNSTSGLYFNDYTGIYVQSTLAGTGSGELINAPITAQNRLFLANYSPAVAEPTLASEGVAGSNNTLTIAGPITLTGNNGGNSYLEVYGTGNIDISGNISSTASLSNPGGINAEMVGGGTLTLSGNNAITQSSTFGGNVVLDDRTNNSDKVSETNALFLGNRYNNYNGNVAAEGANLTILGNQSSATTVTLSSTQYSGASTLTVDGGTATAPTTVNLGSSYNDTYGATLDISTSGTASVYTTSGNSNNILNGHGVTFDKNYYATVDGTGLVSALTTDDGSSFTNGGGNYTVGAGVAGVQTLSGASYANTIRFATAADNNGVASAATLDLGGSTLNFSNGGILVGSDVTTNTYITDGTISGQSGGNLSFINYGTGTLAISANLNENFYSFDGGGTFEVSGNNTVSNTGLISINSGTVILGSNQALGTGAKLDFGSANTTLDLNGHNLSVSQILTDGDLVPGNAAAAAGLNTNITNTAAGTISTLTVAANQNLSGNENTNNLYGYNDMGYYQGGLNEASGAIIALDIEQGTPGSGGTQGFVLGTANPIGDQTGSNTNNVLGLEGTNTVFSGDITVGQNAALGYTGYGFVETTGALALNGNFGIYNEQANGVGVTYLTGTGAVVPGPSAGNGVLYVNVTGTRDTFAGTFGTATNNANTALMLGGGGSLNLPNGIYASEVYTTDGSHLTTTGAFSGNDGLNISGESSITLTGTGGQELGGDQIILSGGTINVSPSGSNANVVVTGVDNRYYDQMQLSGGSAINLDEGQNSSLTVELGRTSGDSGNLINYTSNYLPTLSIGSAQGLSALGASDKLVLLASSPSNFSGVYFAQGAFGIVHPWITGVNTSASSREDATFLSYQGTGTTADGGFTPYAYTASNTDSLSTSTNQTVELVDSAQTLGANASVYALQVNSGGSIDTSGYALYVGYGGGAGNYEGGIILNGASITGTGSVQLSAYTSIYTDLDNGTITNLDANGQQISKNGAGTLFLTNVGGLNSYRIAINEGALDLGTGIGGAIANTEFMLQGGVLQGSGPLDVNLGDTDGDIIFNGNGEGSNNLGGGFSARGGALTVTLNGGAQLVWGADVGGTANFVGQNAPLNFGSTTSDSIVFFENNLNLGVSEGGNQGATALYSRVIDVTANASDSGDPLAYKDFTAMDGVISSSNPYLGLAKTGNGVLYLTNSNTYTGATSIEAGTLAIYSDSALGTAPTAAYALNVGPDVSGAALTPGAIQIDGGATLAIVDPLAHNNPHTMALSSDRQILLASGDGTTAANIDVATGVTTTFGGYIADYVGEVGSLNKEGNGTFNYSGTAYNTGSYAVTAGTFEVSGSGSINSGSGVTISTSVGAMAPASFNYASTVGLSSTVTYGTGGGSFYYNSPAVYTGASSYTIGTGRTIGGGGNLGGTALAITSGGTLTPGTVQNGTATVGALTTGSVTLVAGGNYNFLLADMAGAAGTGYSTVNAASVDLTGLNSTMPFNINIEELAGNIPGLAANQATQPVGFTLFATGANGITALTQTQLNADFAIYTSPNNGATGFSPSPGIWSVEENANDSALVLEYTVPEPTTWAMLAGGLGLLVFIRRLRSRSA